MAWFAAIIGLSVVGTVRADNFYVAGTGTGAGTSWSAAYTNLQHALNAANRDDTIHVAGHLFSLTAQLTWAACTNVTIRGGYAATNDVSLPGSNNPAQWPTILRGGASTRVLSVTGVTTGRLEQVTVTRGHAYVPGGGLYIKGCGLVTVMDCVVTNNYGEDYGGGIYAENSQVVVTRCLVGNNAVDDGGGYGGAFGGGIYCLSGTLEVNDSVIFGNVVTCDAAGRGGGVGVGGGVVALKNVRLSNNVAKSSGHGAYASAGTLLLNACDVVYHVVDGLHRAGGTVNITNSIFWSNGDDLVGTIARLYYSNIEDGDNNGVNGCISADPKFEYGYYLGAGSPCIDAGTNNASDYGLDQYTTQIDGTKDSGRVDIGFHYPEGINLAYADIYVAGDGSDLAAGTNRATAFRSLTKAISRAIDGSRIHVSVGTYTNGVETFPLVVQGLNGIQFVGTNRAVTIVDAGGSGRVLSLDNVAGLTTLSGLTLRGGLSALPGGGLYVRNCGVVTVADCAIRDNRVQVAGNSAYGGGVYVEGSDLTFSNSLVGYNSISAAGGSQNSYGGGIYGKSGTLRFRDSEVVANTMTASLGAYGGGLYVAGGLAELANSLVVGNVSKSGYAIYMNAGTMNLLNCNVLSHTTDGLRQNGGTVNITNCIFRGNGDDLVGTIASLYYSNIEDGDNNGVNGCISADPLFANGYYLESGSPCIDAGTNNASDYGLDQYTTQANGVKDTVRVDIGYHYTEGADLTYADIYVSGNGSDLAAGTNRATAFRSLTKAISRATDGSRIHVGAGSYTNGVETFPLMVQGLAGIQFLGTNRAATIVDAGGAGRVLSLENVSGLSWIAGLTLRGGDTTLPGGGLFIKNSGAVTVSDCVVTNNRGKDAAGGIYAEASEVSIVDCRIVNNNGYTGGGYVMSYGGGLHLQSGSLTVDRSVFQGNQISAGGVAYGGAFSQLGGIARLRNCLIAENNSQAGDGVFVGGGSTSLENCTIVDNGGVGLRRDAGVLAATNCIVWGNGDDIAGVLSLGYCDIEDGDNVGVNGCISANPVFQDAALDLYAPRTGSPCGNAGLTADWMRSVNDLGGSPRLQGGQVDMGCYEFAGGSGSVFMIR